MAGCCWATSAAWQSGAAHGGTAAGSRFLPLPCPTAAPSPAAESRGACREPASCGRPFCRVGAARAINGQRVGGVRIQVGAQFVGRDLPVGGRSHGQNIRGRDTAIPCQPVEDMLTRALQALRGDMGLNSRRQPCAVSTKLDAPVKGADWRRGFVTHAPQSTLVVSNNQQVSWPTLYKCCSFSLCH